MDLNKVFKALLLSTSDGVGPDDISRVLKAHKDAIKKDLENSADSEKEDLEAQIAALPKKITPEILSKAAQELNNELKEANEVYEIIDSPEGYKIMISGQWGKWVKFLRGDNKPLRISGAAMEVLALVAYRQPVTRAEMEMVRGVSVDSALNKLTELELVQVVGQSSMPGKPRLFGTTDKFLEFCGVATIEDLPASDVLPKDKLDEMVKDANKRERYREQELGFAPEEGAENEDIDAQSATEEPQEEEQNLEA